MYSIPRSLYLLFRVSCCLYVVSLVLSFPHLCLYFFFSLYISFFFFPGVFENKYALLLKFWVSSSENTLHKLCLVLCAWMQHVFPMNKVVRTISSHHGVGTLYCSCTSLSSASPVLFSMAFSSSVHKPAQTDSYLVVKSLWSPLIWNISTVFIFHDVGISVQTRTPFKNSSSVVLANYFFTFKSDCIFPLEQ